MTRRHPRLLFPIGLLALGGCAHGPRCSDGPQSGLGQRLFLTLSVLDDAEKTGRRLLSRGGTVKLDSRYDLKVEAEQRAHVYVLHRRPGQAMEPLWPLATTALTPAEPGTPILVPATGALTASGAPGVVSLYVVAAPAPLSPEQAQAAAERAPDARDSRESTGATRGDEKPAYGCGPSDSVLALRIWFRQE